MNQQHLGLVWCVPNALRHLSAPIEHYRVGLPLLKLGPHEAAQQDRNPAHVRHPGDLNSFGVPFLDGTNPRGDLVGSFLIGDSENQEIGSWK